MQFRRKAAAVADEQSHSLKAALCFSPLALTSAATSASPLSGFESVFLCCCFLFFIFVFQPFSNEPPQQKSLLHRNESQPWKRLDLSGRSPFSREWLKTKFRTQFVAKSPSLIHRNGPQIHPPTHPGSSTSAVYQAVVIG